MTDWHTTPPARALLASLSARPPRYRYVTGTLGKHDGEMRPAGKRMAALRKLWRDAEPELDSPEWNEWLRNDPDKVMVTKDGRCGCAAALPPSGLSRFASQGSARLPLTQERSG